jgi:hypothetical protein
VTLLSQFYVLIEVEPIGFKKRNLLSNILTNSKKQNVTNLAMFSVFWRAQAVIKSMKTVLN